MKAEKRSLMGLLLKPTAAKGSESAVAGAVTGIADGLASAVELLGVTVILFLLGLYLTSHYHSPVYVILLPLLGILGTGLKYYYSFKTMNEQAVPGVSPKKERGSGMDGLLGGDLSIPDGIAESARRFDNSDSLGGV